MMNDNGNPLLDPFWRINNLYQIVNKQGQLIKFELNWAQKQLYEDIWYCNIILKARQLGMSTFVCMLFLDRCLFNPNVSAGIIAHTFDDAQAMFRRVKLAYDSLPVEIRSQITADNDTAQMIKFSNGSSLRVGISLRSATFQYLHISEFGKICAKYPDKAREIVTGALNTVDVGQYIFIESTAEGREGYFYDMCKKAQDDAKSKRKLSKLDFKFHFFPWQGEPGYRIGNMFPVDTEMEAYFNHLRAIGIDLDDEQKAWYIGKAGKQGDDMRREFPSTAEEAWSVSHEGIYYSKYMDMIREQQRITYVPYDEEIPVNTAWDLGFNDSMAIWFFQIVGKEIRLIEYLEGSGESLAHWIGVVKNKDYVYDKHIAPHDIMVHELTTGQTRQAAARKMGMNFIPAKKMDIIGGIDAARGILNRCWFDEAKCAQGIKCLENYKKDWDERHACWRSQPCHNWASHGSDAFRTLATGLHLVVRTEGGDGHNPNNYMQNRFNR